MVPDTPYPLPGMELTAIVGWLTQYIFAMLRIGGFLLASPAFGGRFVPLQVRVVATVILTLPVMAGGVPIPSADVLGTISALPMIFTELVLGLTAGLVLTVLFGAAALAGDRIASTAGLGFAAQFDPSAGASTPVIAQLFGLVLTMVFFGTDGHLAALRIVLESYVAVPPGAPIDFTILVAAGLTAGTQLFALGFGIMMPVVAVLLLLNVTVGVITRSAPSFNIFSFGFPLTMTATILMLYITAPSLVTSLESVVSQSLETIGDMMIGAGNG